MTSTEKATRKRPTMDDFANMVEAAAVVEAPVNDLTVPADHALVKAVQRSMDTGNWIKLSIVAGTDTEPLKRFLRRIAEHNFGKGLRIKEDSESVTFLVRDKIKRPRKDKAEDAAPAAKPAPRSRGRK